MQLFGRFNFDDFHVRHAHAQIIGVARIARNYHLILGLDVRQGLAFLDIGAGNTGDGGQADCGFRAIGDNAPLRPHQPAQLAADAVHHFVHLDVIMRGLEHRLLDLRQRAGAADDGIGAAPVDQRTDADMGEDIVRLIGVIGGQRGRSATLRRRRRRHHRNRRHCPRHRTGSLQQVAPRPFAEQSHAAPRA